MISAVILNWARPSRLTDFILPVMERYANISEIIISHGRKETAFNYESRHCRIVHREDWGEINDTYGLSRRFVAAKDAVNEIVLMSDDDMLCPEATLDQLLACYQRQPDVLHGLAGRPIDLSFEYIYKDVYGDVVLVLTGGVLLKREIAEYCLGRYFPEMQDFMRQSNFKVLWNGEDIYQSLVAFKHSGLPNKAYKLPQISFLSIADQFVAISRTNPHHGLERSRFLRYAIEKMDLSEAVTELIKSTSETAIGDSARVDGMRAERAADGEDAPDRSLMKNQVKSNIRGSVEHRLFLQLLRKHVPYFIRRRLLTWYYHRHAPIES